jgi:hypothetical protein
MPKEPHDDESDAFDQIVVELYALPPSEFTAARAARAKGAGGGLAARVRRLRKPVVSAWAVDLLAREGLLTDALELGAALREAQENLDARELGRLGQQRRQLVTALARQAVTEADKRGVAVSAAAQTDIEATLNAALIDPDAAEAVRTARLAAPIEAGEVGELDLTETVSGSLQPAPAPAAPSDELAERRARRAAEQAARDAERAAERAERESEQARSKRDRAQERFGRAHERVEGLRNDLQRAEAEEADAEKEVAALTKVWKAAVVKARSTADEARVARERLD